jgi:hypothetical protein
MPKQTRCAKCAKAMLVPDGAAGARIACPHCRSELLVGFDGASLSLAPAAAEVTEPEFGLPSFLAPAVPAGAATAARAQEPAKKAASRYRGRQAAATAATTTADCVIRRFVCDEDPTVGQGLAEAIRNLLKKEECFASVEVSDDPNQFGRKVTVEDGSVSVAAMPGGFMRKGSCAISAETTIIPESGKPFSSTASAQQQQGSIGNMTKGNVKICARKIAADVVKRAAGCKHMYATISNMATVALIFGLIGIIPFFAFAAIAIVLILGLLVLIFNSERKKKVGLVRVGMGTVFAVLGIVLTILVIQQESKSKKRPYSPSPNYSSTRH